MKTSIHTTTILGVKFIYVRSHAVHAIFVGEKFFHLPDVVGRLKCVAQWLRGLFPMCFVVSHFDCDTARYFGHTPFMARNVWHLERVEEECNRLADGPARFHRISYREYREMKRQRREQS